MPSARGSCFFSRPSPSCLLGTVSTSHISATYLFVVFPFAFLTVAVTLADGLDLARAHSRRRSPEPSPRASGVVAFGLSRTASR
jgi:hypothetical protein